MTVSIWCAICAAPCVQDAADWLGDFSELTIGARPKVPPGKRTIYIHEACLQVVKLIAPPHSSTDIFPMRFDDEPRVAPEIPTDPAEGVTGLDYNLLLSWSLPKWAGPFAWEHAQLSSPATFTVALGGVRLFGSLQRCNVERWTGTSSQKQRWMLSGTHLSKADLISPTDLLEPTAQTLTPMKRQNSKLLVLPDEILLLIVSKLDDVDMDAFRQTCSAARATALPSSYWALRTLTSATDLGYALGATFRTRSCSQTLKPGMMTPGWHLSILSPLQSALASHAALDVWQWWMHGLHWRSRRRIWRCAVEALAAVHLADWLSIL